MNPRRLAEENEMLRAAVERLETGQRAAETELEALRSRLEIYVEESEHFAERFRAIEMQTSNLANLYVASCQLYSTFDRETVMNAIQEIIINLVGSEQVAIFEPDRGGEFILTSSFGVDGSRLRPFRLGQGPIGERLGCGQIYVNPNAGAPSEQITACIPLSIGTSIVGAILVFRLLEHKTALEPVDREIFDLLSVHAAAALYCATAREQKLARVS